MELEGSLPCSQDYLIIQVKAASNYSNPLITWYRVCASKIQKQEFLIGTYGPNFSSNIETGRNVTFIVMQFSITFLCTVPIGSVPNINSKIRTVNIIVTYNT
jgi:hypothetical protein